MEVIPKLKLGYRFFGPPGISAIFISDVRIFEISNRIE